MNGKKLLILTVAIIVIEIVVLAVFGGFGPDAESDGEVMTHIGMIQFVKHGLGLADFQNVSRWNIDGTPAGESTFWSLNKGTTVMMLIIDFFIIIMAFLATKSLRAVPGKIQGVFELIVDGFKELVVQTLGEKDGRRLMPMLGTLFLFLWISNIIGSIPFTVEPTRDLNVTVGHMLVVIFIVHFESIKSKGIGTYLKGYLEPFFVMLPLNVVGELATGVSLSFRLFGNILGGAIIVMVISYLLKYTFPQVGLNLFFSIFVGTIQAFVFTMLSMTYIAVGKAE